MTDTPNLALPLLQPSQAQKHVTVNDALLRLDAAAQLVLQGDGILTPPGAATDGDCFGIGADAEGAWAGRDGQIAVADNGGWAYLAPKPGWRGWHVSEGRAVTFDGTTWRPDDLLSRGASGAGARFLTEEVEHQVVAGPSNVTALTIPEGVTVFAAAARVVEQIQGTAATWRLGVGAATDRFGSGLGLGVGSYANGILGQPQGNYSPDPLMLTGEGGDLAGGRVRLAVHYIAYDLPGI